MNTPEKQAAILTTEGKEQPWFVPPVIRDIGAFLGSLALAYFSGWSTKDLVWSLWLSSLVSGFLYFLIGYASPVLEQGQTIMERVMKVIGGVLGLAYFCVHFGAFHYVHGSILDLFMPLTEQPNRVYLGNLTWRGATPFSFFGTVALAFRSYWSFALLNLIYDYKTVLSGTEKLEHFKAYKNVLKMHFLLFALAGLFAIGLESFLTFALVFAVYFMPTSVWSMLFRRKNESS
ncbi:MAG: hypothetical protein HY088_05145 [Ignavibacteriales bacterium]|nr:hypothetical protein [Ignavibacteriales bacterium]